MTIDPKDIDVPSVELLDDIRRDYDLSSRELSDRAGLSRRTWSQIVRGELDPRLSTIDAIVTALHDADPDGPRRTRGRDTDQEAVEIGGGEA